MLVMMRGMRHPPGPDMAAQAGELAVDKRAAAAGRAAEIARLRRAIRPLRSRAGDLLIAPAGADPAAGAPGPAVPAEPAGRPRPAVGG